MSEKYTVLKKFCNGERQPNQKLTPGPGKPGQCPIGAWYPGEEYTGASGTIDPEEAKRLVKEGLITNKKPKYAPTIDDLDDGQGLKVGKEIVTGHESTPDDISDDGVINRDDDEADEPPADGEGEPEEPKDEAPKSKSKAKAGKRR